MLKVAILSQSPQACKPRSTYWCLFGNEGMESPDSPYITSWLIPYPGSLLNELVHYATQTKKSEATTLIISQQGFRVSGLGFKV